MHAFWYDVMGPRLSGIYQGYLCLWLYMDVVLQEVVVRFGGMGVIRQENLKVGLDLCAVVKGSTVGIRSCVW